MSNLKSTCCQADIKAECADEGTCCYICQKCLKPCDWTVNGESPFSCDQSKLESGCYHCNNGCFFTGSNCPCSCHQPPASEGWETRLERFISSGEIGRPIHIYKLKSFIRQTRQEVVEEVLRLINHEIAIAHKEDTAGKTSRLTSLWMAVDKLSTN